MRYAKKNGYTLFVKGNVTELGTGVTQNNISDHAREHLENT